MNMLWKPQVGRKWDVTVAGPILTCHILSISRETRCANQLNRLDFNREMSPPEAEVRGSNPLGRAI